ncbi:hypothetical protein SLS53_008146 [Cytospora paraplurivora]|uniref:Uncharacterized protein n=1 Tax=Cytospora paraplurivora TaxID=2898453 RepID=A0AAN9YD23_9PEZI
MHIPTVAYSPLERESFFASPEAGRFAGGVGSLMFVRYSDTPVGQYDEMAIIPGAYTYRIQDEKGEWVERKSPRATRLFVSQKQTLFNGRFNWNIPKHLARFEWADLSNGAQQVKVFPFDDDQDEASASLTPLVQATFKTVPYVPALPLSTKWVGYFGVNTALVQPPVPQGKTKELVGTEQWCKCPLWQYSPKTHIGWFDLRQRDEAGNLTALFENFWPGLGRWQLGVRMDDTDFELPEGEYWRFPRANL